MNSSKLDFYLYFTILETQGERTNVHVTMLEEPPPKFEYHYTIDFKSNITVTDVYIHLYFERQINASPDDLTEAAVEMVKGRINQDDGLLQRVTNGRRFTVIDVYRGKSRIKKDNGE